MLVFPKNAEKNASIIEKGLFAVMDAFRKYLCVFVFRSPYGRFTLLSAKGKFTSVRRWLSCKFPVDS